MKVSPARRTRILKARDNAAAILQRHGTLREGSLTWERSPARGNLIISHSTDFTPCRRETGPSERDKYVIAMLKLKEPERLPLQLDIWHNGKVLNIEWDTAGNLIVVGYKPGCWENMLEGIAKCAEAA